MLLTSNRPRNIDRHIDYFGELGATTARPVGDRVVDVRTAALPVVYPATVTA
jgi:hypothetical protein